MKVPLFSEVDVQTKNVAKISSNSHPSKIKSLISKIEDVVYDIYKEFKQYLGIS